MTAGISEIESVDTFSSANAVLTRVLAPGAQKPIQSDFENMKISTDRFVARVGGVEDCLEGLAFIGRLWSLTVWRAIPGTENWSKGVTAALLDRCRPEENIDKLITWGAADERRHVGTAIALENTLQTQKILLLLFATESSRNATKVSLHILNLIRQSDVSLETIIGSMIETWSIFRHKGTIKGNEPVYWFENAVAALGQSQWRAGQLGKPRLSELPPFIAHLMRDVPEKTRAEIARKYLDLLYIFRLGSARRADLGEGYAGLISLKQWSGSSNWLSTLGEHWEHLIDDLEGDLMSRLELGVPDNHLREIHRTLLGEVIANIRIEKLISRQALDERSVRWLKSGNWTSLKSVNEDIAEAAAQELDFQIAEIMAEINTVNRAGSDKLAFVGRKMDVLASKRSLSVFGKQGEIAEFDPACHELIGDGVQLGGPVMIRRAGVVRTRSGSRHVVIKADVVNAEF